MQTPVNELLITYNPGLDVLCNLANLKLFVEHQGASIKEVSVFISTKMMGNPFDFNYHLIIDRSDKYLGIKIKTYEVMHPDDLDDVLVAKSLKRLITSAPNAVLVSDDLAIRCAVPSQYRINVPLFPQEIVLATFNEKSKEPTVIKRGKREWNVHVEETPSRLPNAMRGYELKLTGPKTTDNMKKKMFDDIESQIREKLSADVHVVFSYTDNTQ